jgi:hypothetical protein
MTQQDIEGVYLAFAGNGSYLISLTDIMTLLEAHNNTGQCPIEVLAPDRVMLMGSVAEPWRPLAPPVAMKSSRLVALAPRPGQETTRYAAV